MSGKSTRLLLPAEEIEGDCQGTVDFVFCRIGEPVPLKPTHSDSAFDLSNPPIQPLAVSERHLLLFLAHAKGFLVANTKDVIGLAKGAKGKNTCVQKSSVVDVEIGRVSILAISWDNSMLAATVGGEIHLFYVHSLLDKVQEPAISFPLSDSGIVKDLKWRRSYENSFIVLSSHGLLCHASSDLQFNDTMDKVDAVDWSVDGNFVAIARKDTVGILSSKFEEILSIPLLIQSRADDSGSKIKVDSIKWVRHDSIVIGCTQLNEDGDEDGYLVQVISSREHKFTEGACKPVVFSFPDLFEGLSFDMLPTGVGPYLLADYLDCWNVAITSNKKNIDQHISLLRWLVEDNRYEVVSLELGSDKYIPRIDLQDDGDDNLVLGLAVDKSSLYEKIKIERDLELKELSPRCILLCLTCDGKLTLNHAAWVYDPSDLPIMVTPHGENILNEGFHAVSSAETELEGTTSRLKDRRDAAISGFKYFSAVSKTESCSQGPDMITPSYSRSPAIEEPRMPSNAGDSVTKSTGYEMASDSSMVKGTGTGKLLGSAITAGSTFGSRTVNGTGTSRSLGSTIKEGSSSWSQTVTPFAVDTVDAKHSLSSPSESNSSGIGNTVGFSLPSKSPANFAPFSKPFSIPASPEKINQSGAHTSLTKSAYTGSASNLHSSLATASAKFPGSRQQPLANSTSSKPRQRLESEPQFSKQFYNLKDMAKELDALLSSIECEGGFMDVCTVSQEIALLPLEAGLDDLSELLFVYRDKVEKQRMEIQQLCSKMLEVSARQVYMKGIVQQASDHRYWAFWNRQKLGPEFEAKRLHISNLKQNLTNQLIELERHFNGLEINRFGEYNTNTNGRRAPRSSAPLRQTQSLYSVYNTVNSQLAAAEALSERLSKQMAVLNISSPASEKRNITKELFESIGLDPKTDGFSSPHLKSDKLLLPCSSKRISLSPATVSKEQPRGRAPNAADAFELKSAGRNRDSLDKSWTHFEPSRTTIKRDSKKEQVRSNLEAAFREAKEVFDSQVKAFDNAQKSAMTNLSRPSPAAIDSHKQAATFIAKRSNNGAHINSNSLEQSPNKGVQEKYSKKTIDAHSKPMFKWAKEPLDLPSEPNTSSSSSSSSPQAAAPPQSAAATQPFSFAAPSFLSNTAFSDSNSFEQSPSKGVQEKSSKKAMDAQSKPIFKWAKEASEPNSTSPQAPQIAAAQPFSFAAPPAIFSSRDEKFGSPFKLNASTTAMKFSGTVSPLKAASEVVDSAQASAKNSTPPPSSLSSAAAMAQATSSSTSSSLSSFRFEMPSKSNSPSSSPNESASEQITSQIPATSSAPTLREEPSLPSTTTNGSKLSGFPPEAAMTMPSSFKAAEKDESLDANLSQEDEMEEEEESLDTNSLLNLNSLGGFSLQSTPSSNAQKPNPFGTSFLPASTGGASPQLSWGVSPGQLFRPPSFNLPDSQSPPLPSQSASSSTGGLSGGFSGFGQPAQLGAGQQALGSVLGSFGQSRQLGTGSPGFGFASAAGSSGGFSNAGGFAGAAAGGGFAGAAIGGGFAGVAAGGGFAGASSNMGGFAGAGGGGGFSGAGGGLAAGHFGGGFSSFQGSGGFSGFGSGNSTTAGRPPAELLTQMRK